MIQLITDSTCDMERDEAARLGVTLVPLSVLFGQESFQDGIDISKGDFYGKLAVADSLPTTSQVNPDAFVSLFQQAVQQGDSVVGIFLSSKLSGTFQSAVIARDMVGGDIHLVDSGTVTVGLGLLVRLAVQLRESVPDAGALAAELTALTPRVRLVALVSTLKYLKMGGRISAATAVVGGLLGISPMVSVADGVITPIGKVRGAPAGLAFFDDFLEKNPRAEEFPVGFAHSRCPDEVAALRAHCAFPHSFCDEIGSVIGTHAGPGAYGLAYLTK
ncbi:MAG: DegV family protein [Oscillospiraceae bacterium]